MPRSGHFQIRCRLFAALPISLEVVRDLHALREAVHTRSLNSADVNEHVLATLIRLNKPVALGLVEPFHSPSSHVKSPLRLLRTGSMVRFGWGLLRTHKPVISLSASSRNCRPAFGEFIMRRDPSLMRCWSEASKSYKLPSGLNRKNRQRQVLRSCERNRNMLASNGLCERVANQWILDNILSA